MMEEEQEVLECSMCSSDTTEGERFELGHGTVGCYDCYSTCDLCSNVTAQEEMNPVGNSSWCSDCRYDRAFWCDDCGTHYDSRYVSYTEWSHSTYCEDCIGDHAWWCENCDDYHDAEEGCEESENSHIKSYSYKPDPIFIGESKTGLYMGWELEADCVGSHDRDECAEFASPILEGVAYIKEDSSVARGLEIVTHPIAHNKVRELDVYWDTIEKLRADYGMRSWDSELSCGLHIHLSRKGFSGVAHIHRFMRLIYGNSMLMAKFAGRTTRYATFQDVWDFDEFGVPHRTYSNKISYKRRSGGERNSAVNTYPDNTIELRFFRGTMSKSGILACLDLAQACVEYTRNLTAKDVIAGALGWEYLYDYIERNNGLYPDAYNRMPKVEGVNLNKREVLNA
jgi:hypothetical protein